MKLAAKIIRFTKSFCAATKEKRLIPIPQPVGQNDLLKGKVALITGGSGGIGFAMAESFIRTGCKVVIAGTSDKKLKGCCEKLNENNEGRAKYIVLNVLDVQSMPKKVEEAAALFEENRIDILVNSAGLVAHKSFEDMTEEEYDKIMDVNAKGTFFMSQAVSKHMIKNKIKGHILNLSSSSSLRPAWTPYQMSKWAVKGLTLGMADKLLPYGIVVNAIAPGPVATEMLGKKEGDTIYYHNQPAGRYAVPSEIANLATFMVSDMGNLIVGDTFYITGGSGTITYHN